MKRRPPIDSFGRTRGPLSKTPPTDQAKKDKMADDRKKPNLELVSAQTVPTQPDPIAVREYMNAQHCGYKKAAEHFGISYDLAVSLAGATRKPPKAGPGRGYSGPSDEVDLGTGALSDYTPTVDLVACTREEYLTDRIRFIVHALATSTSAAQSRGWEAKLSEYRNELDQLRQEEERKREIEGRQKQPDPATVARRLLRSLPTLVKLAPEVALEVYNTLSDSLGNMAGKGGS